MKQSRWYRWLAVVATVAVIVVALRTCGIGREIVAPEAREDIPAELTLQTVTLEQPDENGNLLWRLKAKSVNYSPDNQRATLKALEGEFFREGETIYTVVADEGEVRQNGETLYLTGNLVATGKENELTLESERLKWQPKQDLLVMGNFKDAALDDGSEDNSNSASDSNSNSNDSAALAVEPAPIDPSSDEPTADRFPAGGEKPPAVKGFNPQIETIAEVVTVSDQDARVNLDGGVIAKSKEAPWLTFESDNLVWFTEQAQIEAPDLLKVEQYAGEAYEAVSDRIIGETGRVDLTENIVTLDKSVQLTSLAQPLNVQSENAVWDVEAQTVVLDKPVQIEQPERRIMASANRANLDLAQETIYLTGNVLARGEKNDARLAADRVTWQTGNQDIEATGNVSYEQAQNPEVSMMGTQAVGNIEQGTVVVTGGESGEVVTEIVPEGL